MILRARFVVPVSRRPIADGGIEIRRGRIFRVGPWADFARQSNRSVVDLGDTALLPGLVNAHCHLDYTDLAGEFLPPRHFTDWLKLIVTAKRLKTTAEFATSWRRGAQMLLKTGTTTVADIEAVPVLLPRAWASTPLRVISLLELIAINHRRPAQEIVGQALKKIRGLRQAAPNWRSGMSPHSPYSTTADLLVSSGRAARRHGCLVSTHVAESADEAEMFTRARGRMYDWLKSQRDCSDCGKSSPVQVLARAGLLQPRFLAVHANCVSASDVRLLARAGASVVHCPRSHAFFSHPRFPFSRFHASGVNVSLGTDSLASIEARKGHILELDMFAEMLAFARRNRNVSPATILQMATVNGARALGLTGRVGTISRGAFADLVAVPCREKMADVFDAILNHTGGVSASMIEGRWAIPPA